jgi:hypothetical protein
MKHKIILSIFFLMILFLSVFVSAETLSIKGQPRNLEGGIEYLYSISVSDETGANLEGLSQINNDEGYFEVKNLPAPSGEMDPKTIWVQGSCVLHTFSIKKQNGKFVIVDAHEPEKTILITSEKNINLGILKEDKPNSVTIDSDDLVTMLIEDSQGNSIAENGAYKKNQGNTGSIKSNTQYKLTLKTQKRGESWEKYFTTGNYCDVTIVRDLNN